VSKQDGRGRRVTTAPVDDGLANIMHLDMDAFFASVELLEHPELVGQPVVVGHPSARSVVTAATYEARKYGVNSAMSMAEAKRRCPHAVILVPHFERYQHFSGVVMGLLDEVSPRVERLGLDEAFVDVSGARKLLGTPYEIATNLRARVFEQTGLRCSIGVASTKFVAKLSSGLAKPDGLLVVPAAETLALLHPLPISALWGVGQATAERLTRFGLRTVGDIAHTPLSTLVSAVGTAGGHRLHDLAWGRDPRPVTTGRSEKSIGHETTFETDIADSGEIRRQLLRLSDQVGVRLREHGLQGRTIALKVRFRGFDTITRSRTLAEPTDLGRRIYEEAASLFDPIGVRDGVRLVGVRVEQLDAGGAASMLWDPDEPWREAESAMDAVRAKFGRGIVRPASLVRTKGDVERPTHGDD
jgi:DNA polymerase-4